MCRRLAAGAAALLMLALVPLAQAQTPPRGPVLLFADRLAVDSAAHVISAEGNVEVVYGGRRLLSDELRYDQDTDQVDAVGNVVLVEPTGEQLYADRVVLSDDLKTGVIEQLSARLTDGSLFAAATGERLDGNRTVLDRAVYSPCPLCEGGAPPIWQITARHIEHDQQEHQITYHHAFFELYGVPVMYTPYFSHPDPTVERKSGFLSPTVGTSSRLGQFVRTPYYFALAPNYDVTLAPIFTTKEGPVLTAEYRHLLRNGRFEFAGSGTYATEAGSNNNPTPSEKAFRGHLEGEGRFRLSPIARWGYDLAVTTDNTYLQRYKFSNANVLTNRLFTEQIWQRNYAGLNAYAFQGLRSTDHQEEIPFAVPLAEVELTSEPGRWGSRFTFDSNLLALTRTDGLDTRRVSTAVGWELPHVGQLGDQSRLRLDLRGDAYETDGNPETFGSNGGNNLTGRVVPRLTTDWRWPWIGDTLGITPLIEPVASFTWTLDDPNKNAIPNEDSQDLEFDDSNLFSPSRFAGLDRVEGGARVSYGMHFAALGEGGEVASGLFGQSFRFTGENNDFGPNSGINDDFSDYVGRIDLSPDRSFRVRYRFRLDQKDLTPTRTEVGAVVGPSRVHFGVTYLSLEDDPSFNRGRKREEVTAGVVIGLLPSLSLRAQFRRNLQQERDVWHKYGFVYRHPCFELVGGVEQRFTQDADAEDDTTFSIRVSFTNLGSLSADSGMLGSFSGR